LPELPEVETVRRGLEQKLNNFIIQKVEVCRDSTVAYPSNKEEFIKGLLNSLIYKWDRRGKYLIAQLKKVQNENAQFPLENSQNNGFLVVHLRMTGYFKFIENSSHPCKHTRIRFFDKNNNELRYIDVRSFGQMWWINKDLSLKKIIRDSHPMNYFISMLSTTGGKLKVSPNDILKNYTKIKKIDPKKEIVIGFGITEKTIGKLKSADGLVVGSAICKEISKSLKHRQNPVTNVSKLVKKLKSKIL